MWVEMSVIKWWYYGLRSGYPLCCIHEFVKDMLKGELPALKRGGDPIRGYVPCQKCLERGVLNETDVVSADAV